MAIVLNADYADYWRKICEQYGFESPLIVIGGDTRWQSVKNALDALNPGDDDIVLVHDGVRPVVSKDMVKRVIEALSSVHASIPVQPVTDSLRQIASDGTSHAVDRSTLVAVQTPQAFRGKEITDAYRRPFHPAYTDDASVYEGAGYGVPALVEGSPLNIKITHPRDIEVAAIFLGIRQ